MTACRSVAQGEKRRNASRCESGGSSPAIHGEDGHRAVVPVIRSAESLIVDPLIVSPDPSAASTWICSIMASHPVVYPPSSDIYAVTGRVAAAPPCSLSRALGAGV